MFILKEKEVDNNTSFIPVPFGSRAGVGSFDPTRCPTLSAQDWPYNPPQPDRKSSFKTEGLEVSYEKMFRSKSLGDSVYKQSSISLYVKYLYIFRIV